jgi:methionine--tRNA ligase beta chain
MSEIKFSDWEKLELKVGRIVGVEDIENADKLYKLEVDVGEGKLRSLVAGLKQHYTKEELKGKGCVVFCNLEPAVIRGIKSRGMILAAVDGKKDKVVLIGPEKDVETGSKIK